MVADTGFLYPLFCAALARNGVCVWLWGGALWVLSTSMPALSEIGQMSKTNRVLLVLFVIACYLACYVEAMSVFHR